MSPILWQYLAIASTVFAVVVIVLWAYNRREARRKRANELAGTLRDWGLPWAADIMSDYAVGDYSGVVQSAIQLAKMFKQPGGAVALLESCVYKVVEAWRHDPAKLAELRKRLDEISPAPAE